MWDYSPHHQNFRMPHPHIWLIKLVTILEYSKGSHIIVVRPLINHSLGPNLRLPSDWESRVFGFSCGLCTKYAMHARVSLRYACYMYINVTWLLRVSFNGTSKGQLFLRSSVVVWCFFLINWASCLQVEWNALEPRIEPNRWWRTAQRTVLFAQKRPLKIHLNAAGVRVISTFCI